MKSLLISFFNLFLLIGILAYKLRGPLREFVASRHSSIREELLSVSEQLKDAQEQYDEYSSKLRTIDAEVAVLKEQTKQDKEAMKQRVISESSRVAGIVISDARNSAQSP